MRRVAGLLCLGLALCSGARASAADVALAVVVHPERAATLTAKDVARIFLKKRRFWDDGAPIVALNQDPGSSVREAFSRRVLGRSTAQLRAYWNEQYFQGVFPPTVLSSSAAVKRYVATDRNAIGYIEWSEVDESVRVVLRLD
jgi:ABC-type phosphate transport system substrate-binding protein